MISRKDSTIRRDKWRRDNAQAIAEYNELIARLGTFASPRTYRRGSGTVADPSGSSLLRGFARKVRQPQNRSQ